MRWGGEKTKIHDRKGRTRRNIGEAKRSKVWNRHRRKKNKGGPTENGEAVVTCRSGVVGLLIVVRIIV